MDCFSLSLSLPLQILRIIMIYQHLISQRRVNKTSWSNPRQTRICYIFRLWVIIKALLKINSLYLLSHFPIRIIVLTCPDNKSVRNQPKSCVPAKSHKSQWCEANITSIEIFAPFQFVPIRVSTTTKSLLRHLNSGIAEDLHCLKAVDRNFVRNGGTTRTHSSLCCWAGVSEQIANNVLFWLHLSKI